MTFKHKKPQNLHAYVCTPAYDGKVECNYSQSLAEASFCAPLYNVRLTAGVMGNGAFIDLARNVFVKRFLEEYTDTTHLFFIDADLRFPPNAFIGLMQANLPICAGVYRRRQEPEDYPCVFADHPDGGGLWLIDDWVQCKRVPTGFLCIRRDVVEEMAKDAPKITIPDQNGPVPWLFHTKYQHLDPAVEEFKTKHGLSQEFVDQYAGWLPIDGAKFVGEDYGFSDDYVKKYNKMIPVWPGFEFTHGGYKGCLSDFLESKHKEHLEKETSSAA